MFAQGGFQQPGGIFGAAPYNWSPAAPPQGPVPWHQQTHGTPGGPGLPQQPGFWGQAVTSAAFDQRAAKFWKGTGAKSLAALTFGAKYTEAAAGSMFAAQRASDVGGTWQESARAAVHENWALRNTAGHGIGFWDAVTGREYQFDTNLREAALRRVDLVSDERLQQRQRAHAREVQRHARGVEAQAHVAPVYRVAGIDRSTVGGEHRFQEESALQGVRNQAEQAKVEARAAAATAEDAARAREEAGRRRSAAEGEVKKLSLKASENEGADRQRYLLAEADAREKVKLALEEEEKIIEQEQAARMESVEALKAQKEAELQVMRAQLSLLHQREQVATGQARSFGDMTPWERQRAVMAGEMVRSAGWDNVPPEVRAEFRRAAPETAGKMAESAGSKSPELAWFRRTFGEEFRDDLPGIRGKRAGLQDKVEIQVRLDVEDARKAARGAFESKDLQDAIRNVARQEAAAIKQEIINGLQAAQNHGNR